MDAKQCCTLFPPHRVMQREGFALYLIFFFPESLLPSAANAHSPDGRVGFCLSLLGDANQPAFPLILLERQTFVEARHWHRKRISASTFRVAVIRSQWREKEGLTGANAPLPQKYTLLGYGALVLTQYEDASHWSIYVNTVYSSFSNWKLAVRARPFQTMLPCPLPSDCR